MNSSRFVQRFKTGRHTNTLMPDLRKRQGGFVYAITHDTQNSVEYSCREEWRRPLKLLGKILAVHELI